MSDDKTNRGPADRTRINVHEGYEVAYWTKELDATEGELKLAVKTVGVMVADVRKFLGPYPRPKLRIPLA